MRQLMRSRMKWVLLIGAVWGGLVAGCIGGGQTSTLPNSDKNLRKTSAQFAADAAKRHPMNADLPSGGQAVGRAQVGYMLDKVEVWNASDEDWNNIELWANRSYVCFVPKIEAKGKRVKTIEFQMLYDANGNYFPTDNKTAAKQIHTLEMVKDGKIYTIPLQLAD